jgi:hypothetical protein
VHGWRNQPGMMGLRWPLLLEAQQKWLYDGSLQWLWPAAEREGLPIAMMGGLFLPKRTKLPMVSTLDDIRRKWSKRASGTSIVASLYRLAMIPFQLLQQSI